MRFDGPEPPDYLVDELARMLPSARGRVCIYAGTFVIDRPVVACHRLLTTVDDLRRIRRPVGYDGVLSEPIRYTAVRLDRIAFSNGDQRKVFAVGQCTSCTAIYWGEVQYPARVSSRSRGLSA